MQRTGTGELAVVIGAGFGGLAAAVRLRALGYRVLVLEALERAGGRARALEQDGFRFDAGPTLIAPSPLRELFARVGRDVREYVQIGDAAPALRIVFDDGASFDYVADDERLLAGIRALSPRDVDGFRRLVAHARRIVDVGRATGERRRFPAVRAALRLVRTRVGSERSVYALVARYIADVRLRQALTAPLLLKGGSPFRTPPLASVLDGLVPAAAPSHARGGAGAVVSALLALLRELDVQVRLNATVEEIRVRDGRAVGVLTADGQFLPCSIIVSNGDPAFVYARMVTPGQARRSVRRARRMRSSSSLFVACIGARRVSADLAPHTILPGADYEGCLDDIFRRRRIPSDPLLYLQAPTRADPSAAPTDREVLQVTAPVPNNRSGTEWSQCAAMFLNSVLSLLEARLLPGLRKSIVTCRTFTPDDFENELRSVDGAAFGPEPTLFQCAYRRYDARSPDVERLYFVGACTQPGAGLRGVFTSASVLDRIVPPAAEPVALPHLRLVRGRRA